MSSRRDGGSSQLFVGRLSKSTRQREVEDIFSRYGPLARCDVKYGTGMAYAFIDFEDNRDAEDAIQGENNRDMDGQRIVVEWARGPKRASYSDNECYNCGKPGHFARDCRSGGGGDRGRSRFGGRGGYRGGGGGFGRDSGGYSRSRNSRSRSRERRRSRSNSGDRRRSRDSPERRSRSKSRSPAREQQRSRGRDRSRSRSGSPNQNGH